LPHGLSRAIYFLDYSRDLPELQAVSGSGAARRAQMIVPPFERPYGGHRLWCDATRHRAATLSASFSRQAMPLFVRVRAPALALAVQRVMGVTPRLTDRRRDPFALQAQRRDMAKQQDGGTGKDQGTV
jgi:hypothetical protein